MVMYVLYVWSVPRFGKLYLGIFKQANVLNHVFSIFNGGICTLTLSKLVVMRGFLTRLFPDAVVPSYPTVLQDDPWAV